LTCAKALVYWKLVPEWRSALWSIPASIVYVVPPLAGVLGLVQGLRRTGASRRFAAASLLLLATYTLLHAITLPEFRYRVPVADTVLIAWSGVGLVWAARVLRHPARVI